MNIFVLDKDTEKCAQYHCDKHVVKMVLETTQILYTVHANLSGQGWGHAYRLRRYKNHPCVQWAGESYGNFRWLRTLGLDLCKEYTLRYGKVHKCQSFIVQCSPPLSVLRDRFDKFNTLEMTPFIKLMPDEYKVASPTASYKNYYINDKSHLLSYTSRKVPDWVLEEQLGVQK